MPSNELARLGQMELTPDKWGMYKEQASYIAKSGLVSGAERPEQAIVVMLLGLDLGLTPTAALRGIDIIKGKPAVKPQLMAALIINAGHPRVRVVERSDKQCILEFRHKDDDQVVTVSYTWAEAQKAGLTTKDNYQKNPADMLYNRCLGRGARQEYPEIFFNLYAPGEIVEDDVVETTARPVEHEPTPLKPEIAARLDVAAAVKEEAGIDTITDTFGTWAKLTQAECEQGAKTMIAAADLPTAAKMLGVPSLSEAVKTAYPDATGKQQFAAALHLIYERREAARKAEAIKAKAAEFEDVEAKVVDEGDSEDF